MNAKSLMIGSLTVGLLALLALGASCPPRSPAPPAQHVAPFVRGYIAAAVPVRAQATATADLRRFHDVFLPRVEVYLVDLLTETARPSVSTDLSGRFTLPASPGRYRLCWKAEGFPPGCRQQLVGVAATPVHLSTVRIPLPEGKDTRIAFGRVTLSDGSPFRFLEPYADLNVFGSVLLLDESRRPLFEALVNNFGEYLVPNLPVKKDLFLVARVEGGEFVQPLRAEANLAGAAVHRIDLVFANAPPSLAPLVPRHAAGEPVQVAQPGETLRLAVVADDPDGDPLDIRWLPGPMTGSLSSDSGAVVDWTIPNAPGLYSVTVIASDGKGGRVKRIVSVRSDPRGVLFSGTVYSTAGGIVAGASVTVNGEPAKTDAAGFFRLHARVADRYVLNVRQPGFSFLSRILDRGSTGGHYVLRPATVATVDPSRDIDVFDRRSERDCPGPASLLFDAKSFPAGVRPVWQDGKGNVIRPPSPELARAARLETLARYRPREGCGPGVRVRIPAGSLVDSNGNHPAGPVQVSLSTVDLLSPDQMPGDYTVAVGGGTQVMESYGAATVEITAGGTTFNLAPGATAEVVIPVDPAQQAAGGTFPPTIPILFYDEGAGVWRQEGTATLAGNAYVAEVSHFSSINTDLVKTNQSCVRVDAADPGMPGSFRMQVIVPLGASVAPRVIDVAIDNSLQKEHVVYNLPANTNITLAPYDPVTFVPFGTFVVDTGGPQNPTDPNLPFGPPYEACATLVELSPLVLPEDPIGGEFLHGLFSFNATLLVETDIATSGTLSNQLDQATTNYYGQVDPTDARLTLDAFKGLHGFGAGGPGCTNLAAGETCAIFANTGDLGFGREMHCRESAVGVACYVSNYGNIDTPDSDDVAAAVLEDGKIATVAMEFAPIEGDPAADQVVKFFVYAHIVGGVPHPEGVRVNNADLDGKGLRPVPQLCMTCHGGAYPGGPTTGVPGFGTLPEVKLGSEFLPFDIHNYTFAAAPFDKASQQAAFKILNEDIVLATGPGGHTDLLIAEMYDGDNGFPTTIQEELLVVDDPTAAAGDRWSSGGSRREMYRHVVGNACRTCHAANPVPSLELVQAPQVIAILGSVEARVCSQRVMPHAKRTHDLFWLSTNDPATPALEPHQPGILQAFGDDFGSVANGWQGNLCGEFTAGGSTPPSAFADIQSQIFTPICSGCHLGGSPPANLNLQAANAHAQIVGVPSCERPVMDRVEPGSANDSYLFRKVEGSHAGLGGCNVAPCGGAGAGCGSAMPPGGPALTPAQLTLIESWIAVGAPN